MAYRESDSRPHPSSRISSVSDLSSPGLDLYDPEVQTLSPQEFIPPQTFPFNLQSPGYDLPGQDAVDISHVRISPAGGTQQSDSRQRGTAGTPSPVSNRSGFSWVQTDRYEPLSPIDGAPTPNLGLTGRLLSLRGTPSNRLPRHQTIPEGEEIDMGLIGNANRLGLGGTAYRPLEENEHEDELGSMGVDISTFTGPDSPQDEATVLRFRKLERTGQLTGGLGSGLKPDVTIRSTDLYASASTSAPPSSPLEISRRLSRRGSVLSRVSTLRDLGQREANKRGKIIQVMVEDGAEESAPVDLSLHDADHTPPAEFDPSQNRQATIRPKAIMYYPQPNWKPISMRWPYLAALTIVSLALAGGQEVLYQKSSHLASQSPPSGLFQFTNAEDLSTWDYFTFKYLPTMIAVTYGILWQITDYEVKRLEPFYRLSKEGGALAAESINVDYITILSFFRPFKALRYQHYAVAVSSFATLFAVSLVPTLQSASVVLQPDRDIRFENPHGLKFININLVWSRVLTGVLLVISALGFILLCQLQFRRSGLAGDVRGIAGIAAMATKSHVLMDFKDLDTVPPQDIHDKLKNRRYSLQNTSLTSDDEVSRTHEDKYKYDRYKLSANPHPLMLRIEAGLPFIAAMIAFTIFIPITIFTPANVILDKALWLLTALAVAIKIGFQSLEQDVRLMEPFYRLSCRHAAPKVLTLDYTIMAFSYMPIRAALNGDYLMAFVGLGSVFAEVLTVCVTSFAGVSTGFLSDVADSTESSSETPTSFWVSFTLSLAILIYLITVASLVYRLRSHPFLPRQPSTIASVLAFIHQSKMLYDFVAVPAAAAGPPRTATTWPGPARTSTGGPGPGALRHAAPIVAAQSSHDQDLLVKRLADMGKTYGLGWFTGRDGETHCGVDQEELTRGYTHGAGGDARKASKPWLGTWEP